MEDITMENAVRKRKKRRSQDTVSKETSPPDLLKAVKNIVKYMT